MSTDTIGTGGDYTSLQSWFDAIPGTLTEDEVGQMLDEEITGTGVRVTMCARTTGSFSITLECASGASFRDNANVRTNALRYNASNGSAIESTDNRALYVNGSIGDLRIRNLQVRSGDNTAYDSPLYMGTAPDNLLVENCILDGNVSNTNILGTAFIDANTSVIMRNCLVVQRGTGSGLGVGNITAATQKIAHCTVVRPSDVTASHYGAYQAYHGVYMENCAFMNFTEDVSNQPGNNKATDYNATDLSSGSSGLPGSNNVYSVPFTTATFEQPSNASGTMDFRAKSGSALDGAGLYDSTHGTVDITGTTRADPPTIGCWEIVAAGGGPLAMNPQGLPVNQAIHRSNYY